MLVKILRFILIAIVLFILFVIGSFYYIKKIYLHEEIKTPKTIYIPKGSTKSALKALKKSGIDINKIDYYLVKMIGYPQAGWIDLGSTKMKRGEFFIKITKSKAAVRDVTMIPGETKEIFFETLSKRFDLNSTKLLQAYSKIAPYEDGVIIAETYSIPAGIGEEELVKHLIKKSLVVHKRLSNKFLNRYDEKEWFLKYITIASIITKEAADREEMPLVSAVIRNRLKRGMALQMDGTLNYKYQSHKKVTAKMLREDNSKFNTYKHTGLPPHPICSVETDAIKAAINPADVNYLYFVKSKNGKHLFTDSYKRHLKNINRAK